MGALLGARALDVKERKKRPSGAQCLASTWTPAAFYCTLCIHSAVVGQSTLSSLQLQKFRVMTPVSISWGTFHSKIYILDNVTCPRESRILMGQTLQQVGKLSSGRNEFPNGISYEGVLYCGEGLCNFPAGNNSDHVNEIRPDLWEYILEMSAWSSEYWISNKRALFLICPVHLYSFFT